ncbi:MAG: EAL domain-containing protein [Sulfuricurvum sp.]|nr:EAL domain-containing protein [Sulfuricurvum sp.]
MLIPIAEETDLIITLGEWILKEALSKMMKLSETTGFIPKISVNLSPVQFRNQHLNEIITKALQETGFPFEKLELEITEGALVDNPTLAIEKMNQLTVHGITFSIDDFGTGYSSMSYLKKFPVSTLKIDKSFVDDLVTDPHDRAIVQAIITMATSLGIKTIAEGAETIEQVTILNDLECFAIQGYWHSRPLTYTDLLNYFETNTL